MTLNYQMIQNQQPVKLNLENSPGGPISNQFDPLEAWYPVYYLEDLDKNKPNPFTLLERDLVIWWDNNSQEWSILADQCPHRLAPLSQGRINEQGLLECPYHGWTFSGIGECQNIPQQPPETHAETSQRACVKSLPTAVRQGLLFVYPGQPENANLTQIPLVEALEETSDEWVCLNTFRDLPYDAFTLLENVLDSSHIPYTHHRTVGNRINAAPVELAIVESNKSGFIGVWEEGPRKGKLGKQDTRFIAPNLMWHDLTSKQFGRTLTVVYATPIRKGECRLFARFPFKFPSKFPRLVMKLTPTWYSHLGQNRVLEDDQIFLHFQERYLAKLGGSENYTKACYLPTKADLFVLEFRKWVNQYYQSPFSEENFTPALTTEKLLDRYHSHTVKCASCRQALEKIKLIRKISLAVAIIIWSVIPLILINLDQISNSIGVLTTIFSLTGVGIYFGLGNLEKQFYQGDPIPPRNK
jgi:phenylpropionate dioxygenase-like ring-hydroxylating dioxygenase large terminal subunit